MRIRLVAILVLCGLSVAPSATAQVRIKEAHPNEISLSYGVSLLGASMGLVAGMANMLGDVVDWIDPSPGDDIRVRIGGSHGIATLAYSYTVNKTWQFGVSTGFSRLSVHLSDNTGEFRPLTANMFNFMNTAQVNWFRTRRDILSMYTKAGMGVWIVNYGLMVDTADQKTGTKVNFAGQISPVCLEVGRAVSGFLELGVGMHGVIQTGVRVRF